MIRDIIDTVKQTYTIIKYDRIQEEKLNKWWDKLKLSDKIKARSNYKK